MGPSLLRHYLKLSQNFQKKLLKSGQWLVTSVPNFNILSNAEIKEAISNVFEVLLSASAMSIV